MFTLITIFTRLHNAIFGAIERAVGDWLLPIFARFVFFAVLYFYFLSSAQTKLGDGFLGVLFPGDSAYYQIALPAVEAAGGKLHQAKMPIGEYGNIALAFDSEGNMFGLHSMA